MYDLIIIGAGPAGITAAIYAARKRMNFMMVSKDIGGQTALSGDVENYLGYQFITGPDLAVKFKEHLDKFNVELKVGEAATLVQKDGEIIKVQTDKGSYEARTAIVASGRIPRRLGAEGEMQFINRGVTYCATCDGAFFRGKNVAVIGGGNTALEDALYLTSFCSHIYVVHRRDALRGEAALQKAAMQSEKIEFVWNSELGEVLGDDVVRAI
nr:FAD-dependent oxidoreductase [Candidatus Sumerlaeota bacterium]